MKDKTGGRSTERSAACSTCGKTFARSDTLLRHEKNHHSTDSRGPLHRVTDGTFRACQACASARSRCSGGSPCGRCKLRNLECHYPNKRRKALASSDDPLSTNGDPGQQLAGRFSEIVFAADEGFHSNGRPGATRSDPVQREHEPNSSLLTTHQTTAHQAERGAVGATLSADSLNPPSQNDHFGYNAIVSAHNPDFGEARTTFDYSSFDEPLNWIPPSIYPSPYDAELEQDFSFILPTLSATPTFDSYALPVDTTTHPFLSSPIHNPLHVEAVGPSFTTFGQSPASSTSDGLHQTMSNSVSTNSDVRRKKRKASMVSDVFAQPREKSVTYSFPDPGDHWASLSSEAMPDHCSGPTHSEMLGHFEEVCVKTTMPPPFRTTLFPPAIVVSKCIALYFENFHNNCPLIHQVTFESESHWLVILAVATIGSTFAKAFCSPDLREAFQEFLRRAIDQYANGVSDTALDLPFAQSRILNLIGLVQSDREQLKALTPRYHADLSRWCLESGVLQLPVAGDLSASQGQAENVNSVQWRWQRWIRAESLRRVGYLSWMLDCALGYMANARPLCNMDDARTPLPCLESAWNTSNPESWADLMEKIPETSSLCAVLEQLYNTKKTDSSYSDLSQILITHALYQRTWEVGTHIKQPLSEWVPTGKARGFLNTPSKDNFWLPLYPLYANWRNSACDCLDVLHWQASSVVAKASGVEHPLVLQLHLARIVLLTPFQEIQDLLFSLIGKVGNSHKASFYVHDGSYQPRNSAKLTQIRKITWRWLREDQHKARLAMVHAGNVFWYVRRYSAMSFFEPFAVYLASLVLWTYGSYKSAALERDAAAANQRPEGGPSGPDASAPVQPSRMERKERPVTFMSKATTQVADSSVQLVPLDPARPNFATEVIPTETARTKGTAQLPPVPDPCSESDDTSSSLDEQPEFIHLDRPCDDEIIQHFVRNGHNMSGHMSNVGDICKNPHKVLLEGAKLLRTKLPCWGVSREYYDILMRLAELRKAT